MSHHRGGRTTTTTPAAAAEMEESAEQAQLAALLTRASEVIKNERATVAALRECLHGIVLAYAADSAAGGHRSHSNGNGPPGALSAYVGGRLGAIQGLLLAVDPAAPRPLSPRLTTPPPQAVPPPVSVPPPALAATSSVGAAAYAPDAQAAAMATRLRRALAPPPTRQQLGGVVDAMVAELQRDLRRRQREDPREGAPLLHRLGSCTYRLTWGQRRARVVHLTIDSGALCVVVGGGHVNFLEYMDRLVPLAVQPA